MINSKYLLLATVGLLQISTCFGNNLLGGKLDELASALAQVQVYKVPAQQGPFPKKSFQEQIEDSFVEAYFIETRDIDRVKSEILRQRAEESQKTYYIEDKVTRIMTMSGEARMGELQEVLCIYAKSFENMAGRSAAVITKIIEHPALSTGERNFLATESMKIKNLRANFALQITLAYDLKDSLQSKILYSTQVKLVNESTTAFKNTVNNLIDFAITEVANSTLTQNTKVCWLDNLRNTRTILLRGF